MAKIAYNGMELEEFTSDKPVIFDPPKKCIVWMKNNNGNCVELGTAWIHDVIAYLPRKYCKVFTANDMFEHCAMIPEKPAPRRATKQEFARWIAQGKGEWKERCSDYAFVQWDSYRDAEANEPCSEKIVVRKWDDTEWHEPTVDYIGLEEK